MSLLHLRSQSKEITTAAKIRVHQRATCTNGNHCNSQHCDNLNNNNLIFNSNSEFKMNTTRAH